MENNINLIPYRDITLIFWRRKVIGIFFKSRVHFIMNASFKMKSDAIDKLKEDEYITEDLAKLLLQKLHHPVSPSSFITNKSNIHLRNYSNKVFIFKRETLICVFQNGQLDFIYYVSESVKDKVVQQLKTFKYMH